MAQVHLPTGDLPASKCCSTCARPGEFLCSRCAGARYCSAACQAAGWRNGHDEQCRAWATAVRGSRLEYRADNAPVCAAFFKRMQQRSLDDASHTELAAAAAAASAAAAAAATGEACAAALCVLIAVGSEERALALLTAEPQPASVTAALAAAPLWPLLAAAEAGARGLGVLRWLLAHAPAAAATACAAELAVPVPTASRHPSSPVLTSALSSAVQGRCAEAVDALASAGARLVDAPGGGASSSNMLTGTRLLESAATVRRGRVCSLDLISSLLRLGARVDCAALCESAHAVGQAAVAAAAGRTSGDSGGGGGGATAGAAARDAALAVLSALLASPGAAEALLGESVWGATPLCVAARGTGDAAEAVEALLAAGAGVREPPQDAHARLRSPVAAAAAAGNMRCLRALLRAPGARLPAFARSPRPQVPELNRSAAEFVRGVAAHAGLVLDDLLRAGMSPALAYWLQDYSAPRTAREPTPERHPRTLVAAVAVAAPDGIAARALTTLAAAGADLDEEAHADDSVPEPPARSFADAATEDDYALTLSVATPLPPLAWAAMMRKPRAVAALAASGARLDVTLRARESGGATPLAAAVGEALVIGCIDARDRDCSIAAARRPAYVRVLDALLDADAAAAAAVASTGGRLDVTSPAADFGCWPPLFFAAGWAPTALVERLLAVAGDAAALARAPQAMRVKVRAGARDVFNAGITALHLAAAGGHAQSVRAVALAAARARAGGADAGAHALAAAMVTVVNAVDAAGVSPASYAASFGCPEALAELGRLGVFTHSLSAAAARLASPPPVRANVTYTFNGASLSGGAGAIPGAGTFGVGGAGTFGAGISLGAPSSIVTEPVSLDAPGVAGGLARGRTAAATAAAAATTACAAPQCARPGASFLCSRCLAASYCGAACQRAAWSVHKAACREAAAARAAAAAAASGPLPHAAAR